MKKMILVLTLMMVGFSAKAERYVPQVEVLRGVIADYTGVTIQVDSGGCTVKESFDLRVLESYPPQVQFVRYSPDFCMRYMPNGVTLHFTWQDLGIANYQNFFISNPIHAGLIEVDQVVTHPEQPRANL